MVRYGAMMAAKAEDKRVRRTKGAIREALLRTLADKPVGRMTTTELCREAGINRNTFYAHYSTPEDVLAEVEDELLAETVSMIDSDCGDGEVTLIICRAIAVDPGRWRALWHSDSSVIERAMELCRRHTLVRWDAADVHDVETGELFLRFITVGASGVVGRWLEDDCEISPEQLGDLNNQFVFEGRRAISE